MADIVVCWPDGKSETLRDCEKKMAAFCAVDPSYIEYDVKGRPSDWNAIGADQVKAMNRSMQTRSSLEVWRDLLGIRLCELADIPTDLDLVGMSDDQWDDEVRAKLECLYNRVLRRPGIGAASGTKVLHLMRPRLIAIADSLVVQYLRVSAADKVSTALATAKAVRRIGRTGQNQATLSSVQEYLRTTGVIEPHVVPAACRILDALLWMRANGRTNPERAGYHRLWRVMDLSEP